MAIVDFAQVFTKPNSILKLLNSPTPRGYFIEGFIHYGNKQKEEWVGWVLNQKSIGLKIIYKNKDGSKGKV